VTETARSRRSDATVLSLLRRHGELARADLARLCGLPRSTVTDVVDRLRRDGLVVERPSTAGGVGRPARVVALSESPGVIGVLALTNGVLQAAAVGFDGTVYATRTVDTVFYELADGIVEPGTALLTEVLSDAGIPASSLRCAVVCVPLPLSPAGGVPGRQPLPHPNLSGPRPELPLWLRTDPARAIGERLGVPAWAENDANLAALGEAHFGSGRGFEDLLYLKIVVGVGAGIVLGGRLHRGAGGLAGELAHLHIKEDGPVCACGGRGCLMTQFSSPRLVDLVQSAHAHPLTLQDVLALAEQGDPGVQRVLSDLGRTIGRSLADLCVYLNPAAIIVDGMLGSAAEPVIGGIRQMLQRYVQPLAADVTLVRGELAASAEVLGAVALARQREEQLTSR
jgi:predicted NBD/HSP70 family sugar kinase